MPTFTGTNGNDTLTGTQDADTINALWGRDTADGLGGIDTLIADYYSCPVDPYAGASIANVPSVISSSGASFGGRVSTVDGGNYVDFTSIEHLQVRLDFWHNWFIIDASALTQGATILIDGGLGTDTFDANLSALSSVNLQHDQNGTTASFGAIVSFEVFWLNLTEGADTVTTGAGNDRLTGNGGDDVLNSGAGNDILRGGTGSNILNAGDGDDEIISSGIDTVDGGSGGPNHDRWTGEYGSSTENLVFTRNYAARTGTLSNGTTLAGIERIAMLTTGSGNDAFTFAESEGTFIAAGAGEDSLDLTGSAYFGELLADGAGAFRGSLGNDRFSGIEHLTFVSGALDDRIAVNGAPLLAGATLSLNAAAGNDTLILDLTAFGAISFVAGNGTVVTNVPVTLLNFEHHQISSGTGADTITTGDGNDVIQAGGGNDVINTAAGNDLLDGGTGVDAMTGGTGDDIYAVDHAGDTVTENLGEGVDEIRTSLASFNLNDLANVENLTGTAGSPQSLTGNAFDNVIRAGSASNILDGGGGNDTLFGDAGNDILEGGSGADQMGGGTGNDLYYVDDSGDEITEFADGDVDEVRTTLASYTLPGFSLVEIVRGLLDTGQTLTANHLNNEMIGGAGDDVLKGGGGDDILIGGLGADRMEGGAGNDWYFVDAGDTVIEGVFGGASDRVFASMSYTLTAGAYVEILSTDFHAGTASINLSGNQLSNVIFGNAGNNVLDGKGGIDTLVGFGGDDFYFVDHANDYVVEGASEGSGDRIFASVSYTLAPGSYVEIFSTDFHAGTAAINLSGNELGNLIFGNAGNNVLNGRGGIDTLVGFGGDDWYFIDHANDYVVEGASEGTADRIFAGTSYTLAPGSHVEILSTDFHGGTAAINLSGNELANLIYGNAGNNVLDGRGGSDTLIGFGGDDSYFVDQAGDVVVEGASEGTADRVLAGTSYTLAAGSHIEILSTDFHGGTAAIELRGNEIANVLYGNAGANLLDAKGGNDALFGFGGADTFAFTTALGAGNVDTILDFDADDTLALDDAVFAGLALGALGANAFTTGTQATTADHRIVYDQATGNLFFDADGNGGGAAVLFASLNGNPTLIASDFTVI